jgi:hypothetical protein
VNSLSRFVYAGETGPEAFSIRLGAAAIVAIAAGAPPLFSAVKGHISRAQIDPPAI